MSGYAAGRDASRSTAAQESSASGPVATWSPAAPELLEVSAALNDLRPRAAASSVPSARSSGRSAFSPDGRYWWDGARWQSLETPETAPAIGGRRAPGAAVVTTVVVVLLVGVVLAAFAVPALLVQRAESLQRTAQTALLEAHAAQESFRVQHGRYATDPAELESVGMTLTGPVGVEVLATTADSFCLGAARPQEKPRWFMTESGALTGVACA